MKRIYWGFLLLASFGLPASAQKKNSKTEVFKVYGTCEQCKRRIETVLNNYGLYKANWNIESKMLTVSYDSARFSKSGIEQRLAMAGHDTEDFPATEDAYKSLPKCCYYERNRTFGPKMPGDSLRKQPENDAGTHTITGIVLREDKKGKMLPLEKATIRSFDGTRSVTTDSLGVFQLSGRIPADLIISYAGLKTDTVHIASASEITVILKNGHGSNLQQVVVTYRAASSYISSLSTMNTLNIGSRELTKAACCNLSESFETSPSVDVSYTDAVTGVKQIQLLGLSGKYTQITTENTPEIRGLAGSYGMTFIPGPWIEGIQVTKGTGSVANGYESMAGQINIEEKKPDKTDNLFVNVYTNSLGRQEATVGLAGKLNDKWSTALLTHANGVFRKTDQNGDGYLDIPLGGQVNILNRWRYADANGWFAQFALKALTDHRQAGQVDFDPATDKYTTKYYGVGIDVDQYAFSGKLGYVFPQEAYKSIGFIFSAVDYTNHSYYGLNPYDGKQNSLYANLIYQSIIGSTIHKFRTGISFVNDNFKETYITRDFKRHEIVPGAFFEYTYTPGQKFSAIAGFRLDYHNEYGFIPTPRLHLKYDFTPKTNLRFSAGSGFRVANLFVENTGLLVSSRQYNILNPTPGYGYGLNPEKAWNFGFNFTHQFDIQGRKGSIILDAYHTYFTKQVVVDVDASPQEIRFYNLQGRSYSNSFQAEADYELIKRLDIRVAYRWLDVKTDYGGRLLEKPLTAQNRAFINLSYETKSHWKFDFTPQWIGRKRLPDTDTNPTGDQFGNYSPSYFQMSGQITKQFGKKWDLYAGAENLTNYMQKNLFIAGDQPFGPYFDGSMIWGPVNGRIGYLGIRFKLPG
jgi:outer membrane receptor for ferrienterochelin and colicins